MTRLAPRALLKAFRLHPLLPLLLRECRSLDLAQNELRWLRQRALSSHDDRRPRQNSRRLREMCRMRSRGMPLQYILGDQPFGDLEILCRPGVLIPRPETESYTAHTAELVLRSLRPRGLPSERPLRVIDLCTGTGCIALLLHALLASHFSRLAVLGVDLSPTAIELANRNLEHNVQRGLLSSRARSEVHFRRGDVLGFRSSDVPGVEEVLRDGIFPPGDLQTSTLPIDEHRGCEVLISNPPYISPSSFWDGTTARSVRIFEPALALVPPTDMQDPAAKACDPGDLFYHHIVALSFKLRPKLTVLECGDRIQAERVVAICQSFMESSEHEWQATIYPSADKSDVNQARAVILAQPNILQHSIA